MNIITERLNMKRKRILFLTNYFYPDFFRGNDVAFYLAEQGYEVTVLTNIPNYADGKYTKGYGLFKKRKEIVNGVNVIRVPVIPRGNGSAFRMALTYLSGFFFLYISAFFFSLRHKYDVIFVQQLSPIFIGLPAVMVKRIQKIPLYFWILDIWPESLISSGVSNAHLFAVINRIARYIYKRCTKILISSSGFQKILTDRGVQEEKIVNFPNWCEDSLEQGALKPIPELPSGFKIMFAGNMGDSQNFANLTQVMDKLKGRTDIHWVIIGDGKQRQFVSDYIEEHNLLSTIHLMGRYDISYMPAFFEQADVMLVALTDDLAMNSTLPAKVQAYMSAGKPIIGMMNGEGCSVIKAANCGFSSGADDIKGFAQLVEEVASMPKSDLEQLGQNGKAYYKEHYQKSVCMRNLEDILNS